MNKLKNSRILITGGAGFVGSHILDQLIDEDVKEVILIDNMIRGRKENITNALKSKKVRFIEGDIRNLDLLDQHFYKVDYCFHMAALRITRCVENPREAMDVMLGGTYNVMSMCVKHNVKKLVAASSASIYGTADSFPTQENHHPYNNHTFYGALKLSNELLYRSFKDMYGLDYLAMRYFNIYGPRMDREGKYTEVLIRWYHLIKSGKQPLIYGDGKQTMDFIYIGDVAQANIFAMMSGSTDEVYNIASGKETSLEELCLTLIDVMGAKVKPKYISLPLERQKVEVSRRLADVSKAKHHLNFTAKIGLTEGLNKLVQWLDKVTVESDYII
ncbi:MAG: NAD-dependent epimerase/dehydratase family protein [Bacteroidetes bacterium]|nr:NAD-dependent epimerase/dehydratase family protein [Bacteroidota bacterium]